jgi:hypothetical protein
MLVINFSKVSSFITLASVLPLINTVPFYCSQPFKFYFWLFLLSYFVFCWHHRIMFLEFISHPCYNWIRNSFINKTTPRLSSFPSFGPHKNANLFLQKCQGIKTLNNLVLNIKPTKLTLSLYKKFILGNKEAIFQDQFRNWPW